jgi:cyclopropane fatty-acyl-phospholipid synthase-like methyltransferase
MPSLSSRFNDLRNWTRLIFLSFNRQHADAATLYTLVSTNNVLSDKTLFLNLGFWQHAQSYDDACYALAELLANAAQMDESDTVLDAGFGFAEQDLFWSRTFRPARIVGLNVTKLQVELGTQRVRDAGLSGRVHLVCGSASEMAIASNSVTKVVALESAFHFHTRERFFEEAFRVLKPGGRIATTDLVFLPVRFTPGPTWLLGRLALAAWQVPRCNVGSIDDYAAKLRGAGFEDVQVRSIRDQVLVPFRSYASSRLRTPEAAGQMDGFMKTLWSAAAGGEGPDDGSVDYVLASAHRP